MAADDRTPEGERRQATVVFADISGFTAMSEKLDPEDVSVIMNDCFALMEEIVHAHGGTVDKYIGDCIMALFGAPKALEQGPALAVNAAIEMRNRLDALTHDRRLSVPLRAHIGINTGLVLAGQVGGRTTSEFTVMGDAVNLASRLKDKAPNGEIWIGPETHRATSAQFEMRALEPLALKGKEEPVQAWAVVSATEQPHRPSPVGADRQISSPLVGRDQELALLTAAVGRVRHGEPGSIAIVAEAGLGKSRLMAEARSDPALAGVTFLEGRSLSMGESLSFHPFVDLLRHWADITDTDDDTQAQRKLEHAVQAALGDGAPEVFPFVATLMGMRPTGAHAERIAGIEGEALEKLVQKSVRELLVQLAGAQPLVLIFEDLHWADQSSVDLLESLLRTVKETPLVAVFACRPDYADTSERVLAAARQQYGKRHVELRLEGLDHKQCDELVAHLMRVDDLSFSTRSAIARRAEGNPFYIEEVIRSLIDAGLVEQAQGRLRVSGSIDELSIPGTIQEVVMTRVDQLAPATRRVLQVASVVGRRFHERIIAAMLDRDIDVAHELTELKERQLVLEGKTHRTGTVRRATLQPEVEYAFKHALAQETIYESILQRTRRELHIRAAETIQSVFADRLPDFYAMLAYHFSRAEDFEQAEAYLFKAGDEAARSAASNEALNLFREASRLYLVIHGDGGDPARKALLEKNIGLALIARGRLPESVDHFERALAHLGEPVPQGTSAIRRRFVLDLLAVLFRLYVLRGPSKRGRFRPIDREVLDIRYNKARAQTTSDPQRFFFDTIGTLRRMNQLDVSQMDEACGMYAGTALLFSYSGISFGIARRMLDAAKPLMRPNDVKDEFVYRQYEWIHHCLEGDWDERHAPPEELIEENLRFGRLWDVQTYLGMRGEQKIHQGAFAEVERIIAKLNEIVNVWGLEFARSNEYLLTMYLLLQQHRFDEAAAAVDRYYESRDEELLNLLAQGTRARLAVRSGDHDGADTALAKAEDLLRGDVPVAPYYCASTLTSRLHLDLVRLEETLANDGAAAGPLGKQAQASARAALRCAAKVAWERPEVYRLAGRLEWLQGRQARALRWWERSLAFGTAAGTIPELARTHAEIARRLAEPGAKSGALGDLDAGGHLTKARSLFERVDLTIELDAVAREAGRAA